MQSDQPTHQQASLSQVVRQFQSWRASRRRGARIPKALWQSATALAVVHGTSRVSTALAVDYYGLKKRLDARQPDARRPGREPSHAARFVELPRATAQATITCAIEVERPCHERVGSEPGHTKLRIELQGIELVELDSLLRSMWGERA